MDQNYNEENIQTEQTDQFVCSVCHQPIKPEYYFCPNCGHKIKEKPLSTSVQTQIGIYAYSIILPFILYISIKKWPAMKYIKSNDQKTKQIGYIAMTLIILSTISIIWFSFVGTKKMIQSSVDSINADFNF